MYPESLSPFDADTTRLVRSSVTSTGKSGKVNDGTSKAQMVKKTFCYYKTSFSLALLGSGKTTLLSLLTGDHPQSYTQRHLHLHSTPRRRIATPYLHSLVGLLSSELFDAFPRYANMTVWEAIGTGFDGGFVPRGKEGVGIGVLQPLDDAGVRWRVERCWEVLEALGPRAWTTASGVGMGLSTEEFKNRRFVDLAVGEQRMVLLMRALVGRPPLVLLDEVWSGMDEAMVNAARQYLREGGGVTEEQAVVVITHWEDEVPWSEKDGVRRFQLNDGVGSIVDQAS